MAPDNQETEHKSKAERAAAKRAADMARTFPYRWKPGQSGNPSGRPKGSGLSYKTLLRQAGNRKVKESGVTRAAAAAMGIDEERAETMSVAELLAEGVFVNGLKGKSVPLTQIEKALATPITPGPMADMETSEDKATAARERAVAFYEFVMDSEEATIGDRLKARDALDRLQGLVETDTRTVEEQAGDIRRALAVMEGSVPVVESDPNPDAESAL